jgi:hypothetical protein
MTSILPEGIRRILFGIGLVLDVDVDIDVERACVGNLVHFDSNVAYNSK